jgi:Na+/H+ antiporter NhaD/arsenite permease-like protein
MPILITLVVIVFAAMAVVIIRLRHERDLYRRGASRNKTVTAEQEVKRKIEFSKTILMFVMLAYFVTVGVGIHLSLIDPMQYSTLAMLVGAPTATAIGFYAWKAKAENVLKIHKENKKETEGVPFDPGNIT